MSYTSIRKFRIWKYSVSLSFLLLRSSYSKEEKTGKFNIDIEFTGVDYLDIPITLHGISIEEIKENLPEKFAKYQNSSRYRVFQITPNANHYIVAANYVVGKNKWDHGEDRMMNLSLKYDEILAMYPPRG
ncbi:hypothetical protein [Niastella sp. OAS944]|uniref:hypothetical protein n=1 Tax=Niastella sp. OAS944 TaxID=2664089 RepID=UPI00348F6A17|nr:hypothetical protein [Chitinophagaceae bacterium OAS944]